MSPRDRILSRFPVSRHALEQMAARNVSFQAVEAALLHGRVITTRQADICVIGRREVQAWAKEGIDLSRYDGVHVVCSPGGTIMTAYRNKDLHGLCRCHRRHRPRCAAIRSTVTQEFRP